MRKKEKIALGKNTRSVTIIVLLLILYGFLFVLDNFIPMNAFTTMLIPVLKKGAIYSLVAVSMNLLNGFTGLFSLGHAGFMLIGAYAYAIFTIPAAQHAAVYQYFNGGLFQFSIPEVFSKVLGRSLGTLLGVIIAILIAGIITAIVAALIGIPVLRLKSDYLAIATLGFAEIIRAVFQWNGLGTVTNGSNVLRKYTSFTSFKLGHLSFSTMFPYAVVTLCVLCIILLINSTYGRAFKAIRDDEIAAEAMGINLFKHKMESFIISSFFAGVGGALLAMYQTTIQAAAFKTSMTYEILLIVVIGGMGSLTGSCIASFLFIACSEWWLRFLDSGSFFGMFPVFFFRNSFRMLVFSVIIMIMVLFFRKGIMGDREFSIDGILTFFRYGPKKHRDRKAKKEVAKHE